jgi:hypothetical protein
MDFDPPIPSRRNALEMLALCREKLAELEREAGRFSARAVILGYYLKMVEAAFSQEDDHAA